MVCSSGGRPHDANGPEARHHPCEAALLRVDNVVTATFAAGAVLAAAGAAAHLLTAPRRDVLLGGRVVSVDVADTPLRRYVELALRRELADGHGMLFLFDDPLEATFVRRGVPFALDVVFVGPDGRVSGIGRIDEASGESRSPGPAVAVVELPAGWCTRNGVATGALLDAAPTP